MERIEVELLEKLKNSQKIEQDAFSSLEQAIKSSTGAYEERKRKVELSENQETRETALRFLSRQVI